MRCRSRHHQRVVRAIGVGDKCLLTAQREAIATLLCYRGSTNRVGSRVRLGDREAKARLAATRIGQIAQFLRFAAVFGYESQAHCRADDEV